MAVVCDTFDERQRLDANRAHVDSALARKFVQLLQGAGLTARVFSYDQFGRGSIASLGQEQVVAIVLIGLNHGGGAGMIRQLIKRLRLQSPDSRIMVWLTEQSTYSARADRTWSLGADEFLTSLKEGSKKLGALIAGVSTEEA